MTCQEGEEGKARTDIVELCKQHVKECKRLEKTTKANDRVVLFECGMGEEV